MAIGAASFETSPASAGSRTRAVYTSFLLPLAGLIGFAALERALRSGVDRDVRRQLAEELLALA